MKETCCAIECALDLSIFLCLLFLLIYCFLNTIYCLRKTEDGQQTSHLHVLFDEMRDRQLLGPTYEEDRLADFSAQEHKCRVLGSTEVGGNYKCNCSINLSTEFYCYAVLQASIVPENVTQ